MPKIIALSSSFSKNKDLQKEIYKFFPDAILNVQGIRYQGEDLINYIKDADGIVVGLEKIDEAVLKECKNLKIISKYGVGLDSLDLKACEEYNIKIGWTGGVNKRSVSEMALGFMLMLCRNLYRASNRLKNNNWNKNGGIQLSGKTVGIIGLGNIGKDLVELLQPFGCKILVNDIIDQNEYYNKYGLIEVSKNEIYENADFVTVHTPSIKGTTQYMINIDVFKRMKNNAFFINTARGDIVVQDDLKRALGENIIAGAAIDVYQDEPPTDNELLSHENLITTPHIGGNAGEAIYAMGMSAINHLKKFFIK